MSHHYSVIIIVIHCDKMSIYWERTKNIYWQLFITFEKKSDAGRN